MVDLARPNPIGQRMSVGVLVASVALCAYSALLVYSATHGRPSLAGYFPKQITWVVIGLVLAVGVSLFDYSKLQHYFPQLYAINLVMLVGVFLVGHGAKGAQRWYNLKFMTLQPSEFAKLLVILFLAAYIAYRKGDIDNLADVAKSFGLVAVPMVLIMRQPDLGTSLVLVAIWLGMLVIAGLRWQYLAVILAVFAIFALVALMPILFPQSHFHILSSFQLKRLIVFADPGVDRHGSGYNLSQSKIAIGSGGFTGKGLLSGTQTNLNFLPERHTDFIFSVLGEELGFVGALILLLLYGWLLMSALRVASASRDPFGTNVAAGIAIMWAFQMVVNIGMTTGIMPVTGIPLPFISYGGSSMWTHLIASGLLMSIWFHRHPGTRIAKIAKIEGGSA
jgi:rod shape determining protein RodA